MKLMHDVTWRRWSKTLLAVACASTLGALPACDGGGDDAGPDPAALAEATPDLTEMTLDDEGTVELGMAELGLAVGEPSQLHTFSKQVRDELNAPMQKLASGLKQIAQAANSTQCRGIFCDFDKQGERVNWHLRVAKVRGGKTWWRLAASSLDGGAPVPVAFGHFLKTAPRQGVSWTVMNFDNMGAVDPTFVTRGIAQAQFNNVSVDKRIRLRLFGVDRTGNGETVTAGFGFRRHKVEGYGRFRFAIHAELLDGNPGKELLLGRARWSAERFGRGDAVLLDPQDKHVVGRYHECWDDALQLLWAKKVVGGAVVEEIGAPTDCGAGLEAEETPDPETLEQPDPDPETEVEDIEQVDEPTEAEPAE
jgi:hypothetical protein